MQRTLGIRVCHPLPGLFKANPSASHTRTTQLITVPIEVHIHLCNSFKTIKKVSTLSLNFNSDIHSSYFTILRTPTSSNLDLILFNDAYINYCPSNNQTVVIKRSYSLSTFFIKCKEIKMIWVSLFNPIPIKVPHTIHILNTLKLRGLSFLSLGNYLTGFFLKGREPPRSNRKGLRWIVTSQTWFTHKNVRRI